MRLLNCIAACGACWLGASVLYLIWSGQGADPRTASIACCALGAIGIARNVRAYRKGV